MEASYSPKTRLPISIEEASASYYAMPGIFLTKTSNGYKDSFHELEFDSESVKILSAIESNTRICETEKAISREAEAAFSYSLENLRSFLATYEVEPNYFETVDEFGYNVNGTCTVLATAILFGYYDNYVNQQYVPDQFEDSIGTTEAFHQLLNNYVYGNSAQGGIYIRDTVSAMNRYLGNVGIRANYQSQNGSPQTVVPIIISKLQDNRPIVASTSTNLSAAVDHSVVIYGTTYNTSNKFDTAVFHVHTGWHGDTYKVWSASWFYEFGYISCALSSHGENMTYWIPIDNDLHGTVCYCGEHTREYHLDYVDSITGICSKCGWRPM